MHFILGALIEFFYFCIFIPTIFLGYFIPLTGVKNSKSNNNDIVFIHGIFNQNVLYYFFKKALEKKGLRVYMTNFGLLTGDMTKNSVLLSNFIKENNLKNIILIGASEGGIIALYYLQKLNGWSKVEKLITIASPFGGFPLARLAKFSISAKQMTTNSAFLKDLFKEPIQNINKIIYISAKFDEIVPENSSVIKGAKNEKLNIIGHINLIAFSGLTHKAVLKEIQSK